MVVARRFWYLKIKRSVLMTIFIFSPIIFAGCSLFDQSDTSNQSVASSTPTNSLEMPPNLIKPTADNRYNLPASGEAKLSDFSALGDVKTIDSDSRLLPVETDAYLVNYGGFKVLVIERSPEEVWSLLKSFWVQNGFEIEKEIPETGFIETNWVESREKVSDGLIRNTLSRIFNGLYDTGERDKFRIRVERTNAGFSEISVVHKGLIQVASDDRFDPTVVWVNKDSDQQLEELYLRKIITFISAKGEQDSDSIKIVKNSSSSLKGDGNNNFIELDLNFDAAWKSVGLILDRLDFEVEERSKPKGTYLIRYKKLEEEKKEKGFLAKIFSSDKKRVDMNVYRIEIKNFENISKIFVFDFETNKRSKSSQNILAVIHEQLNQ